MFPDLRQKSDVFKHNFNKEKNILRYLQIDALLLGCFNLNFVKGNFILFRGELARSLQRRQGMGMEVKLISIEVECCFLN